MREYMRLRRGHGTCAEADLHISGSPHMTARLLPRSQATLNEGMRCPPTDCSHAAWQLAERGARRELGAAAPPSSRRARTRSGCS
eukprot:1440215-Prymnesium_polylepis.2